MLVSSTSVYPAQSVIISRKMSILGFVTAVTSILFGTTSSRADTKSINDNGCFSDLANGLNFFLGLATRIFFFLSRSAKSFLSKSLTFVGSIYFLHSFAKPAHD